MRKRRHGFRSRMATVGGRKVLANQGATLKKFGKLIAADIVKWTRVAKDARIRPH